MLSTIVSIASAVSFVEICKWGVILFTIVGALGLVLRKRVLFCASLFLFGVADSVGKTEILWEEDARQFTPQRQFLERAPGDRYQVVWDRPALKPRSSYIETAINVFFIGVMKILLWLVASFGISGAWLLFEGVRLKGESQTMSAGYASLSYCAGTIAILGGLMSVRVLATPNPIIAVVFVPIAGLVICLLCSKWAREEDERYLSVLSPSARSTVLAEREREARELSIGSSGNQDSGGGHRKSRSSGPPPIRDRSNDMRSATH